MSALGGTDQFDWIFKIHDNATGPAMQMSKALHATATSLVNAAKASERFDKATSTKNGAIGGFRNALFETIGIVNGIGAAISGLATMAINVGGGIARAAGSAFIGFNSDIEQSIISIASVDRMFRKGHTFEDSKSAAQDFFNFYQDAAKASTATTKEFLGAHGALAPTLTRLGAADEQIRDIVKGAVIAAPTLGFDASVAQLDIRQLLTGQVSQRDQFATTLLQSLGLSVKTFNAKAKSDPKYAINVLGQALSQPAIIEASKAMEGSFKGLWSTLVDTLEIGAGSVGKPIFTVITGGLKDLNQWMSDNKDTIDAWGKAFGEGMKNAGTWAIQFGKDAWAWLKSDYVQQRLDDTIAQVLSLGKSAVSIVTSLYRVGQSLYNIADSIGLVTALRVAFEYLPTALDIVGNAVLVLSQAFEELFAMLHLGDLLGFLIDGLSEIGTNLVNWFEQIGEMMTEGMLSGMLANVGNLIDGVTEMGGAAVDAMKDVLGIASPSKVFAEIGEFSAEGFNQGFQNVQPELDLSQLSLPASGSGPSGRAQIVVNLTVEAKDGTTREQARAYGEELREQLLIVLEDFNAEVGG